ncbi:hypothetical protein AB4Z48_24435 [Cupriavidus sp. 2TAF22]|uniref:hypothetical protein n=1 Tax=unclassified Cupriavidus TaxID=2640874 RepID=UPI003F8FC8BB
MTERTTSRVIPRIGPNDSIPLLTEVIDLPADASRQAAAETAQAVPAHPVADRATQPHIDHEPSWPGPATHVVVPREAGAATPAPEVPLLGQPSPSALEGAYSAWHGLPPAAGHAAVPAPPSDEELRAVRSELLTRVMMRFRTEWPQVVEAHTEATLQSRLAPLTAQLAAELTQALEARLVEWLDATLEEIERDPGGV